MTPNNLNRRKALVAMAAVPIAGAGATPIQTTDTQEALHNLLDSVVPHNADGYQVVKADALKRLCVEAGVTWRAHWADSFSA